MGVVFDSANEKNVSRVYTWLHIVGSHEVDPGVLSCSFSRMKRVVGGEPREGGH